MNIIYYILLYQNKMIRQYTYNLIFIDIQLIKYDIMY